jgi:hypothetical protein
MSRCPGGYARGLQRWLWIGDSRSEAVVTELLFKRKRQRGSFMFTIMFVGAGNISWGLFEYLIPRPIQLYD